MSEMERQRDNVEGESDIVRPTGAEENRLQKSPRSKSIEFATALRLEGPFFTVDVVTETLVGLSSGFGVPDL